MKYLTANIIRAMALLLLLLPVHAVEPEVRAAIGSGLEPDNGALFTPEELKWLEDNSELTYVYDPDWVPFEWRNEIDNHTGIIADVLGLIGERTGIAFRPVKTGTWEESVETVKAGKADMFSAITVNSEREEYLSFTQKDIYSYPAVFVTLFDDEKVYLDVGSDLKGKRVGVVRGSGLGDYIRKTYPGLEYVDITATDEGFGSILKGEIDVFAINAVTAKYYIEKKGYSDLKVALKLDYVYHLKMAVRKELAGEIVSILDKSLGSIKESEFNDIFNKWTEASIRHKRNWKLLVQVTAALLAVVFALLWSNRRLNRMVASRTEELDRSLAQTQQANKAKSLFLSSVSHDIRTPMNGVLGMLQVLRTTSLNDVQKKYVDTIESSGKYLVYLVDDLLDLSRIESGKLTLNKVPFKTAGWLADARNLCEPLFADKQVALITKFGGFLPACLEGDVARINQIIVNLVSNAEKFTSEGVVELSINGRLIANNEFNLNLSVKDTGVGIAEDKLNQIFQGFSQVQAEGISNPGVGLGLAICKRLADAMGGDIEVTSRLGEGSCFVFNVTLPVLTEGCVPDPCGELLVISREISILLVDDNAINRVAARVLLEKEGHNVVEAENGRDAIAVLGDTSFDVILMDVHMPVMGGLEATRKIREGNSDMKNIPIIGITASVMKGESDEYLKAGMDAVMAKPISIDELMRLIAKVI